MQPKDEHYFSDVPPPILRQRGCLLTLWLILYVIGSGFAAYAAVRGGAWLSLVWALVGIASGVGTWLWFKLGVYGMMLGYLYNMAIALDNQSVFDFILPTVFMGLTFLLVQSKWEFFR